VCVYLCAFFDGYNTGWRRLIGCLKLQVIFRTRATNHRALLRKITYEDKASYGSSPPCSTVQELLDWFEADLGFTKLFLFRFICVLCAVLSPTLSSPSPLVLFRRLSLPPPRGGSASRVSPRAVCCSVLQCVAVCCSVATCWVAVLCGSASRVSPQFCQSLL